MKNAKRMKRNNWENKNEQKICEWKFGKHKIAQLSPKRKNESGTKTFPICCWGDGVRNSLKGKQSREHEKEKVAQLTKVIFYLNTKNDEYENNLKSVVACYEGELDTIVKECNNIISRYKDAVDKLNKNEGLNKQFESLKNTLEYDKN